MCFLFFCLTFAFIHPQREKTQTEGDVIRSKMALLDGLNPENVTGFCKFALESLVDGRASASYTSIAKKMKKSPVAITDCVLAISKIFVNLVKKKRGTMNSVTVYLNSLDLPANCVGPLSKFYIENRLPIRKSVTSSGIQLHTYKNVDWRLQMELSRRMTHSTMRPTFLLKLDTTGAGESASEVSHLLEADLSTITMIKEQLRAAVKENDSVHMQRLYRYVR